MVALEICVEDLAGVYAARDGGADRVELCAALAIGGVLPAPALVAAAVATGVPLHVLVRLEAGGFVTDAAMVGWVAREIERVRDAGAAGVVVGALTPAGALDAEALSRWRAVAGGLTLTLHRAIDLAVDPVAAVALAVELGVDRILTSGGAPSAMAGAPVIARMVAAAAGRVEIMAGAGVNPQNAAALLAATGVPALHASASAELAWDDARIGALGFGGARRRVTSLEKIRMLRLITNAS